jgi:hypothetical protein
LNRTSSFTFFIFGLFAFPQMCVFIVHGSAPIEGRRAEKGSRQPLPQYFRFECTAFVAAEYYSFARVEDAVLVELCRVMTRKENKKKKKKKKIM